MLVAVNFINKMGEEVLWTNVIGSVIYALYLENNAKDSCEYFSKISL